MKTLNMMVKEKRAAAFKMMCVVIALLAFLFTSCDETSVDADTSVEDQESVEFDSEDDFYLDDVDDMASVQLEKETGSSGGKISGETDERFSCAEITRTGTEESGTIVIDFGEGCQGPRGHVRKGKIIIDYSGRRNDPGSFWAIEFEDYFINNVAIEGLRKVNNISESGTGVLVFKVDMENGTMTWPDGRQAKRTVHRIREHHLDDNNLLDRLIVYGTAEGNHRNGRGYFIEIIEPLVYSRECKQQGIIIPVEGVKSIKHGARQITVDYGDGECDNIVVMTNKNGKSWRHQVGN